jgi:hypothetical protein
MGVRRINFPVRRVLATSETPKDMLDLAERLERGYGQIGGLSPNDARTIAAALRRLALLEAAALEAARALDELRVLTEGIVAQRGPLGDATVDRILRRAMAASAGVKP